MAPVPVDVEVLVVGGGIAGAGLALLLARRGIQVVLADHGRLHRSGPHETLLGSARPLLERLDLGSRFDALAVRDPLRHGAVWGSDELVWRQDAAPGWLLARGAFDAGLRTMAAAAGAVVCERTVVHEHDGGFWLRGPDGQRWLRPRTVVMATGRTGRRERRELGPRTFAFTLVGEVDAADRGTAVVEAVADGWIWTHALAQGPGSAAVMLDAAACHQHGRSVLLARALRSAHGPAGRMSSVRLATATDATAGWLAPCPDRLRLGDAAASIDPLASQGVEKALAAADHAAAAIATALLQPSWWPQLCAQHAQWERELAMAHGAVAADWYGRESRFAGAPFWRARQPVPAPPLDPQQPLQAAGELGPAMVLVRQGDRFVAQDGIEHRGTGDRLAQIGFVPVAPLLRTFAVPRSLAAGVAAAGSEARLFVLPPRAVWQAAQRLLRMGWLVPAR
ncbi:MAG: FAD-dependent monooxygenase [Planctomycetes bacterium]|jgi:2-polyprenyl-6-methoxyphenol hydroxylase-like FAD-dependent oxidoreductase|nr:FAD-dependent monooxygenase [Planctomycetota bacterium]